jgi:glycosyltransferase involved in cell wall biosynthesis
VTSEEKKEIELSRKEIRKRQAPIRFEKNENTHVSVVIVTYRRHEIVVCLLDQLSEQEYDNFEIIVVDSSPEAEQNFSTLRACHSDRLTYIVSKVPFLGVVRNIGLLACRGEIVIFLDDDTYIDRDFISRHVHLHGIDFGKKPMVVVGNCVARPNEPSEWVKNVTFYCPDGRHLRDISCGGGHFSVSREAAIALGGFVPWIRLTGEETEFINRFVLHGGQAINAKEIVTVHRCARKGGTRDDPGTLLRSTAIRMADRLVAKSVARHIISFPLLILGSIVKSLASKEIIRCISGKGFVQLLVEYLWYCISNSPNFHGPDGYLLTSTKLGQPYILSNCSPPARVGLANQQLGFRSLP